MSYLISFVVFLVLVFSAAFGGNMPADGGNNPTTTPRVSTTGTKPIGIIRLKPASSRTATTTKPITTANKFTPPDHTVSAAGIFYYTNEQRTKNKIPVLKLNKTLQKAAEERARDMIAQNYFDHTSPSGQNVADVATKDGYMYRFLGENLAMGDFSTSEEMVNDWMQSPGHRANILNPEYTQLGVAAVFTEYMGRKQWLAVQVFGKPF